MCVKNVSYTDACLHWLDLRETNILSNLLLSEGKLGEHRAGRAVGETSGNAQLPSDDVIVCL